jgi:hypothetical protein
MITPNQLRSITREALKERMDAFLDDAVSGFDKRAASAARDGDSNLTFYAPDRECGQLLRDHFSSRGFNVGLACVDGVGFKVQVNW